MARRARSSCSQNRSRMHAEFRGRQRYYKVSPKRVGNTENWMASGARR